MKLDRILYLINEKGIKPNEIIVLAFMSKATDEIKDRLRENSTGETIKEVHSKYFSFYLQALSTSIWSSS